MQKKGESMIVGIGVDIIAISRVEKVYKRYKDYFGQKILAVEEWSDYQSCRNLTQKIKFLAKRFAAKEAFVKALGTGFSQGVRLGDIAVTHDVAGKPGLTISGVAETKMKEKNINSIHLSLSDEKQSVVAFVVLE